MALRYLYDTFTCDTTDPGTQELKPTGAPAERASLVFLQVNNVQTTGTSDAIRHCIGMACYNGTTTKGYSVLSTAKHNVGTTDTGSGSSNTYILHMKDADDVLEWRATLDSVDADGGITISWASGESPSLGYTIQALFIYGLENVDLVNVNAPRTAGTDPVSISHSWGKNIDGCIIIHGRYGPGGTVSGNIHTVIGAYDGTNQACITLFNAHGKTATDTYYGAQSGKISQMGDGTSIDKYVVLNNVSTSGFDLDNQGTGADYQASCDFYVAYFTMPTGFSFEVLTEVSPTSTGTHNHTTSFEPGAALIYYAGGGTSWSSAGEGSHTSSIGLWSQESADEGSMGWIDEEGQGTTDNSSRSSANLVDLRKPDNASDLVIATHSTQTSTTLQLNYTTVDTAAHTGLFLLFEYESTSTVSGTGTLTDSSETADGVGDVIVSGTSALTDSSETADAVGTVTVSGTGSITDSSETVAASGSVPVSGTGSLSDSSETADGVGTLKYVGTGGLTDGSETADATGTVLVSGTGSLTDSSETVAGAGTLLVSGTGALTDSSEQIAAAGSTLVPISGTGSLTDSSETADALGTLKFVGTGGLTDSAEQVASTGTVSVSGTASITDGGETAAGVGAVTLSGTGALTDGGEAVAAVGGHVISGTGSLADASETAVGIGNTATRTGTATLTDGGEAITAAGGGQAVRGTATLADSGEQIAATGGVKPAGTATLTDSSETHSGVGRVIVKGIGYIVEGKESVQGSSRTSSSGTGAITERSETVSGVGSPKYVAAGALTDSSEAASAAGTVQYRSSGSLADSPEELAATGTVKSLATGQLTDSSEVVAAAGRVVVSGTAALTDAASSASGVGAGALIRGTGTLDDSSETPLAAGGPLYRGSSAIADLGETPDALGQVKVSGDGTLTDLGEVLLAVGRQWALPGEGALVVEAPPSASALLSATLVSPTAILDATLTDMAYWHIGSTEFVSLTGLYNLQTAAYINDATVTGQMQDCAGTAVGGSISGSYVGGSDGDYYLVVPAATTALLNKGDLYTLQTTVTSGSLVRIFHLTSEALHHGEEDA